MPPKWALKLLDWTLPAERRDIVGDMVESFGSDRFWRLHVMGIALRWVARWHLPRIVTAGDCVGLVFVALQHPPAGARGVIFAAITLTMALHSAMTFRALSGRSSPFPWRLLQALAVCVGVLGAYVYTDTMRGTFALLSQNGIPIERHSLSSYFWPWQAVGTMVWLSLVVQAVVVLFAWRPVDGNGSAVRSGADSAVHRPSRLPSSEMRRVIVGATLVVAWALLFPLALGQMAVAAQQPVVPLDCAMVRRPDPNFHSNMPIQRPSDPTKFSLRIIPIAPCPAVAQR